MSAAHPSGTHVVTVFVKEPDEFGALIHALGISDEVKERHFEFGEYATFELEIDEKLRVVSGRIVPRK